MNAVIPKCWYCWRMNGCEHCGDPEYSDGCKIRTSLYMPYKTYSVEGNHGSI